MSNFDYYYNVYLNDVFSLAGTMLIKSEFQAVEMNNKLIIKKLDTEYIDWDDKTTWPYYLNICGEYHPDDEPIKVISMDTLEEIVFNKENLEEHLNTREEYSYGTRKYKELITRYPDRELLIKGILYPADMDKAISSPDGTILSYNKIYVDENEYSLIDKLQDWVYGYFKRWYNKQYNINNKYYNTVFIGMLYIKLIEAIISFRLDACLTNEAHSYHIRRYLASHGFIDYYLNNLTKKQSIKLYKNIRWVERLCGQTLTQEWLIKYLLTERNIPIAEYNFKQNYEEILDSVFAYNKFYKKSINGLEYIDKVRDFYNLEQMLNEEDELTLYNPTERVVLEPKADRTLQSSLSGSLKTKVLESKQTDYTNSETYSLYNAIIDSWIDLADRGLYNAYIIARNPISGESIILSASDAFLLYAYCVQKYFTQIEDDCIPTFNSAFTAALVKPTKEELSKLAVDKGLISDNWYKVLLSNYRPATRVTSNNKFYDYAYNLFTRVNNLLAMADYDEDLDARAYKEAMVYYLFPLRVSNLGKKYKTYTNLLKAIALDTSEFEQDDYYALAADIWERVAGKFITSEHSVYNTHKAMIGLMEKLSSYSVHYIRKINESDIIPTNMKQLRVSGVGNTTLKDEPNNDFKGVEVTDHSVYPKDYNDITDIEYISLVDTYTYNTSDIDITMYSEPGVLKILSDDTCDVGTRCWIEAEDTSELDDLFDLPGIPGITTWINTPIEMKKKVTDQWGVDLDWDTGTYGEPKEPLDWDTKNNRLSGLHYNPKKDD